MLTTLDQQLAYLHALIDDCNEFFPQGNPRRLERFFSGALLFFYDGTHPPMQREVGHLLYRLSDVVPSDVRSQTMIYPSSTGSIGIGEDKWSSLEDFRKSWESLHSEIPLYVKQLPTLTRQLRVSNPIK